MLQVLYETEGRTQVFTLSKDVAFIGRANDNDIVLNDFSVSRRHAFLKKEEGGWVLYDNQSTNGVQGERPGRAAGRRARRRPGADRHLHAALPRRADGRPARAGAVIDSTSTRIRPIAEFNQDFGLEKSAVPLVRLDRRSGGARRWTSRYKNRVFEILVQVAKALISADDLSAVLDKVMDLIFEFLPADRGYLLLEQADGTLTLSDLALQDRRSARPRTARRRTPGRSWTWSSSRRSRS